MFSFFGVFVDWPTVSWLEGMFKKKSPKNYDYNKRQNTTNSKQRQTTNDDKQLQMTNNDKQQTMTNDKQRQTTNNDKRPTTINDKRRTTCNKWWTMTNDKQWQTTNNDKRQTTNDKQNYFVNAYHASLLTSIVPFSCMSFRVGHEQDFCDFLWFQLVSEVICFIAR